MDLLYSRRRGNTLLAILLWLPFPSDLCVTAGLGSSRRRRTRRLARPDLLAVAVSSCQRFRKSCYSVHVPVSCIWIHPNGMPEAVTTRARGPGDDFASDLPLIPRT